MRLMKKCSLAKAMMKPINTSLIMLLGLYTTLWGFWLINPFWRVFTRAPLYDFMERVAPESAWGAFAIMSGVALCYGVYRHSARSLIWGAFVGYFFWGINSLAYFLGDWRNTGGITSFTLAVYCFVIFLNLRKHYKWEGDIPS